MSVFVCLLFPFANYLVRRGNFLILEIPAPLVVVSSESNDNAVAAVGQSFGREFVAHTMADTVVKNATILGSNGKIDSARIRFPMFDVVSAVTLHKVAFRQNGQTEVAGI